jgi:tetratricopeptide (TPR) repeat protein
VRVRDRLAKAARRWAAPAAGTAFAIACLTGAASWLATGCSGWDPRSPFEHDSPDVDKAIQELDAGNHRSAEDILEEYLGTGPCSDAGIGIPDSVKQKPNASFDLGLTLFYLGETFGAPFGDEEEGAGLPEAKRMARLRALEVNCALLVALAIATDPSVPIELRARAHYLAGNLEFIRRRYEEAVKHYDEALKLVPGILEEAGGDDIGRDAAWNRAIALRRIQLTPLSVREDDGGGEDAGDGGDGADGEDGADGPDTGDADGDIPDDAGDAADGGDGDAGDSGDQPDGAKDGGEGDGPETDAPADAPGDAPGDAGADGSTPEPVPVGEPMPVAPDSKQDDRILEQLEQAPTYQEQDAKNRGQGRRGRTMEDK